MTNYKVKIINEIQNSHDDNIDVEIVFDNNERYFATFFTLKNIKTIMDRHKVSGECRHGIFFCATDMIIVEKLDESVIYQTIAELDEEGSLASYCTKYTAEEKPLPRP